MKRLNVIRRSPHHGILEALHSVIKANVMKPLKLIIKLLIWLLNGKCPGITKALLYKS